MQLVRFAPKTRGKVPRLRKRTVQEDKPRHSRSGKLYRHDVSHVAQAQDSHAKRRDVAQFAQRQLHRRKGNRNGSFADRRVFPDLFP